MGYRFKLEDINIVAFITTPNVGRGYSVPYISMKQLKSFLHSFNHTNLISSDSKWTEYLIHTAQYCIGKVEELENQVDRDHVFHEKIPKNTLEVIEDKIENDEIEIIVKQLDTNGRYINTTKLKKILTPLQAIFSDFDLYGVVVYGNDRRNNEELEGLAMEYAASLLEDALILITDKENYSDSSFIEILSAAKPFGMLSNINSEGILFWDTKGNSTFLPLKDLLRFLRSDSYKFTSYINRHLKKQLLDFTISPDIKPTILHLSDLHFGNEDVSANVNYFIAHLETLKGIEHVVITGDLIENPDTSNCLLYKYFIEKLTEKLRVPITAIAGNHDYRRSGVWDVRSFRNCDVDIGKNLVVNDSIKTIFFCIDSNVDGNRVTQSYLARGHVSREQLVEIGEAYQKLKANRGFEIDNYNKIALIHHHPFPFSYETETYIKQAKFYMEDIGLKLNNADEIIDWCNDMNINLILHGHKHLQRYVTCQIDSGSTLDSIGCGTSTGTKGNHLSYNLISINNPSKTYNYVFYRGKNNGSGFYPEYLKMYRETR